MQSPPITGTGGAMEEERPWADLHPDLVSRISSAREMSSLVDYTSLRAVFKYWRSTVPPATPLLIYTAAGPGLNPFFPEFFASAFSLPSQRQLEVRDRLDPVLTNGSFCVGSCHGWLAIDERVRTPERNLLLMHPIYGTRIRLPELKNELGRMVKKVVFAPKPSVADFTAVALYGYIDNWRVAYARSGDEDWTRLPQEPHSKNAVIDLVYHDDGRVYCLTMSSGVRVIHLPGGDESQTETARVERLLPDGKGSLPFDPATVFTIPRFILLSYIESGNNDKRLVFCEGNMYQVWRNLITMRRAPLYGGLHHTELKKEIIVLKYDPGSWPCWQEVYDLSGYSMFIGKNNAVSLRVAGTPWLKANCVYWIGGVEEEKAMVFDMVTQTTEPCVLDSDLEGFSQWASCWYFLK